MELSASSSFPHDLDYIPAMAEMILSPGNNSDRVALPPHSPEQEEEEEQVPRNAG